MMIIKGPTQLLTLSVLLSIAVVSPEPVKPAIADGYHFMPGHQVRVMADERYIPFYLSSPPTAPQNEVRIQSVAVTVNYNSGSCNGVLAPWPLQAQTALAYAINTWSGFINGSQPITIDACWRTDLSSGVLGVGGPQGSYRDFPGVPVAGTWYPVSLANQITGNDLNGSEAEIEVSFNSSASWYTERKTKYPMS